jgi:hypothetical protein
MEYIKNPFDSRNSDQSDIWEMLVRRDINAFVTGNWNLIESDFLPDKFYGLNAQFSSEPQMWKLDFPLLVDYKKSWIKQSYESSKKKYADSLEAGIHKATKIEKIEINSGKAAVWKQFNGRLKVLDGEDEVLQWQTIYFCEIVQGQWKIIGFVGYLPLQYMPLKNS